jgi:hypothetical protein
MSRCPVHFVRTPNDRFTECGILKSNAAQYATGNLSRATCNLCKVKHRESLSDIGPIRFKQKLEDHLESLKTKEAKLSFLRGQWFRWVRLSEERMKTKTGSPYLLVDYQITLSHLHRLIVQHGERDAPSNNPFYS